MPRSWPALELSSLDDLVQAALVDHAVAAIDEDAGRVFFHTNAARDLAADALRQQFPSLTLRPLDVADDDWAARSQASLTAVRVGRIIVAPPWDAGHPKAAPTYDSYVEAGFSRPDTIEVVIQPSMGFGTGHHATTRLCLAHLQEIDLAGHTAIDVGTGSGVLAIAASRLGAIRVLAIDDDEDAIQSARENLALNPDVDVTLGVLDLRRAGIKPFEVVLANLTGGLLVAAAPALLALAVRGGRLVLSGFMESEEAAVIAAFAACEVERRAQEDEWVAITLRR